MKTSKQVNKIIDQFMKDSFKDDGHMEITSVNKNVATLKSLPIPDSIMALSEYMKRIKSELQRTTLVIESTFQLASNDIRTIITAIKSDHQVNNIRTIINPFLLGGLKVTIGDVVYDDSVSQKILQLGETIRE